MPIDDMKKQSNKTSEFWRKKNSYYYAWLDKAYIMNVRPGSRVLQVGCENGDLLAAVKPSYGLGIDSDEEAIEVAKRKYPEEDVVVVATLVVTPPARP